MQKTSDDYFRELKAWYEQHRKTLHAGLLVEPSNGDLKNLCLKLLLDGLCPADEEVLRLFFKVGKNDDLRRVISNADIEKFRPIVNFLRGTAKTRDGVRLNLIALLVGFPKRPLSVFLKDPETGYGKLLPERSPLAEAKKPDRSRRSKNIKLGVAGLGLVIILIVTFLVGNKTAENCMIWQGDHYVSINCKDTTVGQTLKEPFDEKQYNLKKVAVSKNIKFFVDGKPQVWYLKRDGKYEFFNQRGYHPVNREKKLRPITSNIAMKIRDGEIKGD